MTEDIVLNNQIVKIDQEGYLVEASSWDSSVRDWMAEREGIGLTEEHLAVIKYLHEYFAKNNLHPEIRVITQTMGQLLGSDKGNGKYFHRLFPAGLQQADKIAGLPKRLCCC